MPIRSPHPPVAIPDVDIWTFLFARPALPYPPSQTLLIEPPGALLSPEECRDPTPLSAPGSSPGRSYSYAEVRHGSAHLGHALHAHFNAVSAATAAATPTTSTRPVLGPGAIVTVFSPNSIDIPVVAWAGLWLGCTVAAANPASTVPELVTQLRDSGPDVVFTQRSHLAAAVEACRAVGIARERIVLIGGGDPNKHNPNNYNPNNSNNPSDEDDSCRLDGYRFRHIRDFLPKTLNRDGSELLPPRPVAIPNPSATAAFLVYSSGTTGLPKGVLLSHTNIVANVLQLVSAERSPLSPQGGPDGRGDRVLGLLPMYHIYGLTAQVHSNFFLGLPVVVVPTFSFPAFCRLIEHYRIGFLYAVPHIVLLLSKHPLVEQFDLRSVRMVNSGAAPLGPELVAAVWDRLRIRVKQGYGLSEAGPTTHVQSWDESDRAVGSVGKLVPNMEALIVEPGSVPDPDGPSAPSAPAQTPVREVPPTREGEMFLAGPNVFLGYHNRPDLFSATFYTDRATGKVYLRTGDVARVDRDGNFFVTDRVKELIKFRGNQVAPAEVEGVLVGHPDVDDAAVVGVWDRRLGTEVPRGYVVLSQRARERLGVGVGKNKEGEGKSSERALAAEIVGWVASRVARHKRLRGGVFFVDAIPKNPSGKILRRVLRDRARAEAEVEVETEAAPEAGVKKAEGEREGKEGEGGRIKGEVKAKI